jgi:hypothetical protein
MLFFKMTYWHKNNPPRIAETFRKNELKKNTAIGHWDQPFKFILPGGPKLAGFRLLPPSYSRILPVDFLCMTH